MSTDNENISDQEKQRLLLKENISKLWGNMFDWMTWHAEYESLNSEVQALSEPTSTEQLHQVRDTFPGGFLDRKELNDIFGQQQPRSREQIINLLERRVSYVFLNIGSIQNQIDTAEAKLAEYETNLEPDNVDGEELPTTEIFEELDDDDNVVSYRLNHPDNTIPSVQEALREAGIEDLSDLQKAIVNGTVSDSPSLGETRVPHVDAQDPVAPAPVASDPVVAAPKKSVAFAADTKAPHIEPPNEISQQAKRVEHIMKTAREQAEAGIKDPVIPDDEDPEDALLRREMLKYGMGEVGAVVAELELEDNDEDDGDDDDSEWLGDDSFEVDLDDDEDDDDDDGHGRYKGRILTEDYQQRMLELEQKLGIQSRFTTAANAKAKGTNGSDADSEDERIGRIVVKAGAPSQPLPAQSAPKKSILKQDPADQNDEKKGVRFAQTLNVPEPGPKPVAEPLSDIVERTSTRTQKPPTEPIQRQSRFKKARDNTGDSTNTSTNVPKGPMDITSQFLPKQEDERPIPTGPPGMTIADKLVEKEITAQPTEPTEIDDSMLHLEIADEHNKLRNRFIQREGGFLKDEEPIQQLNDFDDGTQRVSRFKAARLSRQ